MKARVKATGEIIEVFRLLKDEPYYWDINSNKYDECSLDFNVDATDSDYWEKLKHQYAGMAMQGIWNNNSLLEKLIEMAEDKKDVYLNIAEKAIGSAHALVEKLKNE